MILVLLFFVWGARPVFSQCFQVVVVFGGPRDEGFHSFSCCWWCF